MTPIILDDSAAEYVRRRLDDLDALMVKLPSEGPLDPPTPNHWDWRSEMRGTLHYIRKAIESGQAQG